WYTSVIPHLLVPELALAILASPAKRLVTLNLAAEKETAGLPVPDHLYALTRYLPGLRADVVLADGKAVGDPEPVHRAAESLGARLVLAPVAEESGGPRHDPTALAAELDTGAVARRLRREVAEVYGYPSEIHVLASGGLRKGSHYIVRVVKDGEALARQTGLLDVRGRPVRGLPPHVVSASVCCAVAAWRGAFMGHGSLTEPGRSCTLEITCPGPESALALVGAAR